MFKVTFQANLSCASCLLLIAMENVWGAMLKSFGVQVGGLGDPEGGFRTFLESMLGLVGHTWGFGRPRGHREGVWKGLGWLRGGWGPGSGTNMGPT